MDKEKQIEEMAKDICRLSKMPLPIISEYLINIGYRKINQNEIVISKEEYERLIRSNYQEGMKERRKELQNEYDALRERYAKIWKECEDLKKSNRILSSRNFDLDIKLIKTRKETAEKCRDFVKQWASNSEEGLGFLFDFEDFIVKHFGVDLGE